MRVVVLGNPENRRLTDFAQAVVAAGHTPDLIAWRDLLAGRVNLAERARAAAVKLDSPGEDWEVERRLIALGADVPDDEHPQAARVARAAALGLEPDHGRLRYPRQWYRGFVRALEQVGASLAEAAPRALATPPATIATLFHKPRCHAALVAAQVPTAPALSAVEGYAALREVMQRERASRVFVKLSWGSSASGVLALEAARGRVQATTSVELVDDGGAPRLYNSLRIRRYTDEAQVARIVDALAPEGVHVERWLPKASLDGRAFDLRVLVLAGRARHAVVRSSRSPLTNLHLGNARGDLGAVQRRLGPDGWRELERLAERADACFPGLYAGVDLLVTSSWRRRAVVEVNAFGDLLPRLEHEGQSCYEAQAAALIARAEEV